LHSHSNVIFRTLSLSLIAHTLSSSIAGKQHAYDEKERNIVFKKNTRELKKEKEVKRKENT